MDALLRGLNWLLTSNLKLQFNLTQTQFEGGATLGADRPEFWQAPPEWALPLRDNALVVSRDERRRMNATEGNENIRTLRRRATRSSYVNG